MLTSTLATAQVKSTDDNIKNDIRYNLNTSGSHYVKFTFTNQTWLRFNDNNPGSTVLGDAASQTFDIGLRRTRMQLFGQPRRLKPSGGGAYRAVARCHTATLNKDAKPRPKEVLLGS